MIFYIVCFLDLFVASAMFFVLGSDGQFELIDFGLGLLDLLKIVVHSDILKKG